LNIKKKIKDFFVSEIVIPNNHPSFQWILKWLSTFEGFKKESNIIMINSEIKSTLPKKMQKEEVINMKYIPSFGTHTFYFKNKKVWIRYEDFKTTEKKEIPYITLSTYFYGNTGFLFSFIEDCRLKFFEENSKQNILIYTPDSFCTFWEAKTLKTKRDPSTVFNFSHLGDFKKRTF
jgi:hypothetical protein